MKSSVMSIIAIVLGIIIVAFPLLGALAASTIIGLSILLLAIWLLISGVSGIEYDTFQSVISIVIGIIALILSLGILFIPSLFAFLASITLYLAGILLIIIGLVTIIGNRDNKFGFWPGVAGIVLGVIYFIVGTYIKDPLILGALIGIWLIITGVFQLIGRN
ncbi:MAG: DUF308 domain-containing protein [Methanobacteriaceae archaeon]